MPKRKFTPSYGTGSYRRARTRVYAKHQMRNVPPEHWNNFRGYRAAVKIGNSVRKYIKRKSLKTEIDRRINLKRNATAFRARRLGELVGRY